MRKKKCIVCFPHSISHFYQGLPDPHAPYAPEEHAAEDDIALELQRRLEEVIIEAQQAHEELESVTEMDLADDERNVPSIPLVTVTPSEELESEEIEVWSSL